MALALSSTKILPLSSFVVGVSGGQGVLRFARRNYPLSVAGVSIGFSAGASQANLVGTISNIRRASDIAGTYSAATAGAALVTGGKTVFMQSDVCNNIAVFVPHPDWQGFFDQDPPKAAATRRRVYDMLVADKLPVPAYHFPYPALGRVEKVGDGYRVSLMNSL